jgi:hypothetical protein
MQLACFIASGSVDSAVCTKSGPSAEPPMPIATTLVSGLPVTPFHSAPRTRSVGRPGNPLGAPLAAIIVENVVILLPSTVYHHRKQHSRQRGRQA